MRIVLASKSPRRQQLMKQISSDFIVDSVDIDEELSYSLTPIDAVKDISIRKGKAIKDKYPSDLIITADTIVVLDNKIIGKPINKKDAFRILKDLSGREHKVYTGYTIQYLDKIITRVVESKVIFNRLSDTLINEYIKSGSPLDKAGAYGVQDNENYPIIKKVIGSVDNVVGFPVKEIKEDINRLL